MHSTILWSTTCAVFLLGPECARNNMELEIIDYYRERQQSKDRPSTEGPHKSFTNAVRPLMIINYHDVYSKWVPGRSHSWRIGVLQFPITSPAPRVNFGGSMRDQE